jgi:hypothetical protein
VSTAAPRLSQLLPPLYVQRLLLAAALHNAAEIDCITDELAWTYPELVRSRADDSRQPEWVRMRKTAR